MRVANLASLTLNDAMITFPFLTHCVGLTGLAMVATGLPRSCLQTLCWYLAGYFLKNKIMHASEAGSRDNGSSRLGQLL
jgi:hypothetical protein